MAFQKLLAFSKTVSDLSDKPALTPTALKAQFDSSPNELKDTLNSLIDALKSTTSGDSGAKNLGATTITDLTGSDVQSILESFKTYVDGRSYTKTEMSNMGLKKQICGVSPTISLAVGATNDFVITYPAGYFAVRPSLTYSVFNTDTNGEYQTADSIVVTNNTTATIRLINKGTAGQNYQINWQAVEI